MTDIEFHAPLACSTNYPSPDISATPKLVKWASRGQAYKAKSQFKRHSYYTKNGRSALAHIIQHLGLKPGARVLLPEYHCPAMIEPFVWANIHIEFYPLNSDLSVNMPVFEKLLRSETSAVLLVRFFGFPTNIDKALVAAKHKQVKVIEDCAHAYFSEQLTVNGFYSDASFCSLNKFFSCFDGGKLRITERCGQQKLSKLPGPGPLKEIKHILGKFDIVNTLSAFAKQLIGKNNKVAEETGEPTQFEIKKRFLYFNEADMKSRCFSITKMQIAVENHDFVAYRRRQNYRYLYDRLADSTIGRCLYPLDEQTVPYILPFLLNSADDFNGIRQQGIQILRWEEFCPTDTEIEHYRERLIQIPCHQDLSQAQLDFIVDVILKK